METYLLDWANLLLRWLHVIVAIAWIGSSFYFVFLDSSLTPPEDAQLKKDGVSGELWAVHGGGFYHPVKFAGAPPKLPGHLHWFYWESYSTWLSGFALFLISYLWSPSVYLIDPKVMAWSPAGAIAAALAFLVVFWLLYDAICRTLGQSKNGDAKVGALVLVLVGIAAYAATQLFAGRAAFLIVGAMIATAMSANVFFWIIPGQRTVVADIQAGRPIDPIHGKRGKQRSVHNTYFTLPVLFSMLSNHYSFTYSHEHNWAILIGMMFAGAAIRQFFVLRHGFKLGRNSHPWPYAAVGVFVLLALIVWLRPAPVQAVAVPDTVSYAQLKPIMEQRCVMCHGEALASKNVRLDSPEAVKQHAQAVYQQVVVTKLMPMNNATGLTEEERALIAQWFKGGARVD
ncbi:MAG: urate hydroxylase PuuD [Hydrogenophaga sp.]|uniref:urate hydroxylase PuuD n=1 Tax=Hydrogenophaga sp. TaxID=1904254 RepID=UPI002721E62C|nr:urate hydroxylase PuuD [Hydrogenophaga sp.]MDO9148867.1 urate hydroxylase PuuD [Hydrogenophaga sp.]MDO9606221.1 urate hydroxylase PuuD [Hydrogenophaga sp.]